MTKETEFIWAYGSRGMSPSGQQGAGAGSKKSERSHL